MCKDPVDIDSTHNLACSTNHFDAAPDSDKERRLDPCTTVNLDPPPFGHVLTTHARSSQ